MAGGPILVDLFLSNLAVDTRERPGRHQNLEALLSKILQAARTSWPRLSMNPEVFLPYLARIIPDGAEPEDALGRMMTADLYLTCGCACGDPEALATFERIYSREITGVLSRMNMSSASVEDVKQLVYKKLFVDDGVREKKIVQYSGEGELGSWIRVVAMREALNYLRKGVRECRMEDEVLADQVPVADDQELVYLKVMYRQAFKQAFQQALGSLSSRERNILRHHLLDGLNFDQVGVIYDVHRATVSRWMSKVRKKLLSQTRRVLTLELGVSRKEFDSVMRLIESQLDVSIRRFLKGKGG
jgi:RNA polymerase sigma-70 factor (ECF subfamily)